MGRDIHANSLLHVGPGTLGAAHPIRSLVISLDGYPPAQTGVINSEYVTVNVEGVIRYISSEGLGFLVNAGH